MKNRIIITWIVSIAILPCMLVAAAAEKQEQESAVNIAEQLQDIDKYISQSRKRTEEYFLKKLEDLKVQAEDDAKLFEQSQRDELSEIEEAKRARFRRRHGRYPRNSMVSDEQVALVESRITEKKESILAKLEQDIQRLEKQRDYTLNSQLPYQEARLKKELLSPEPEPSRGTVTGIIYGQNKQLALINHEIVKTGDVIHDVKIVAICRNTVKFEKNGKTWKQRPGQSPDNFN